MQKLKNEYWKHKNLGMYDPNSKFCGASSKSQAYSQSNGLDMN